MPSAFSDGQCRPCTLNAERQGFFGGWSLGCNLHTRIMGMDGGAQEGTGFLAFLVSCLCRAPWAECLALLHVGDVRRKDWASGTRTHT